MVHTIPLRPSLLLDLPLELITVTLCFLDAHALLECSLVNTTLHSLIATTPELQYTLALFSDGLTDSPSPLCTIPARERLCLLRARRRAWRSLAFTQKDPVRLRGECAAYELVGGVFAKAGRLRPGNMLSDPRGPSLSMCWLPDSSNPVRIVERDDVGVQARDFAMDPSQDLLVLVELPDAMVPVVHVHLRTLSTNSLHPSAKLHTLVHVTRTLVDSAVVQIAGDVIAFFWSSLDSPGLVIWNWMTGEALVTAISATPLSIGQAWDFDFLSPRSFILVNLGHVGAAGSLSLFSIEEAPYSKPKHEPRTARFVARLHLPTLTSGTRMANISVHSGPHPGGPPAPHLPFSFIDGTQMHVISVDYFREQDVLHHRFSLFVRNRTLQSFIYASPITHNENGEEPVDVPWEVWGPANTRFMPQYAPFGWLRYTHGARVCLPPIVIQDGPVPSIVLRVLDFGVRPALWNNRYQEHRKGVLGSEEYEHEGCDGERSSVTTLFTMGCEDPERKFFANPVCTSLPCVIVERQEEEWRYTAFMMDDQRLIGMKTNPFTLGDMKDLDVFVL